ncbi:MAG: sodium:solute symporter family protein [Pirellulales bacterium]
MILAAGHLQRPDYFVLIGYFALMLGIGLYFFRRMQGMKDYFSGGNQIPWWLSGVSFYMSSFSVATFVQYSALAYLYGQVAVTLYWVTVPATLVSVMFFSRRWRRARIDSPVEYLETRYSGTVRQLFAWQGIVVRLIDSALKLVAIGIFVHKTVGIDMKPSMLGAGLIMLAYTFLGGLWAVTVTDFIQFIVLAAGVLILLPLSLREVGGFEGLLHSLPDSYLQLTHTEYNWFYIASNILLFSLAFSSVQWSLIQRYYCVPTERDAYKVGGLVVVLNIVTPPLMFLPAIAASRFLPGLDDAGHVYPLLCAHLLPAGMFGLVIAAMFSATMSMLSSDYNVCASVLTNDVYKRLIRPDAPQRELVWVGRLMTLAVGLVALALAWSMSDFGGEDLFRNMITLFSIATAPMAIPMIAGLLSSRVTHRAALAGFLAGVAAGLVVLLVCPDLLEYNDLAIKKANVIFFGASITTLVVMLLTAMLDRATSEETRRAETFIRRLDVPIGEMDQDRVTRTTATSPFTIVGISIALIGGMMLGVLPTVEDNLAFMMDLAIGLALAILGAAMVVGNRLSKRKQERTL